MSDALPIKTEIEFEARLSATLADLANPLPRGIRARMKDGEALIELPMRSLGLGVWFGLVALAALAGVLGWTLTYPGVWSQLQGTRELMSILWKILLLFVFIGVPLSLAIGSRLTNRERVRVSAEWLRVDRGSVSFGRTFGRVHLADLKRISLFCPMDEDSNFRLQAIGTESRIEFGEGLSEETLRWLQASVQQLVDLSPLRVARTAH